MSTYFKSGIEHRASENLIDSNPITTSQCRIEVMFLLFQKRTLMIGSIEVGILYLGKVLDGCENDVSLLYHY